MTTSKHPSVRRTFAVTLALSAFIVTPLSAAAVEVPKVTSDSIAKACTRIVTAQSGSKVAIAASISTMESDFANRLSTVATREDVVDQNVTTARAKIKASFAASILKLESRSNLTAVQKTAIETYSDDMNQAELTRETTVDTARAAYRTVLSSDISTHQMNLTAAANTFQTNVNSYFATATANCGTMAVAATLRTNIEAARATYKAAIVSDKVTSDIKQHAAVRDAAIKAADDAFTTATTTITKTVTDALAS